MQSKSLFLPVLMALLSMPIFARAQAAEGEESDHYTLQVAAFPDREPADDFIKKVEEAGERPFWGTVELPGRGRWIRIFIGSFATPAAAKSYGRSLVERGTIKEFVVKRAGETRALSRPRTVNPTPRGGPRYKSTPLTSRPWFSHQKPPGPSSTLPINKAILRGAKSKEPLPAASEEKLIRTGGPRSPFCCLPTPGGALNDPETAAESGFDPATSEEAAQHSAALPEARDIPASLAPPVDAGLVPHPNPVRLALKMAARTANEPESAAVFRAAGGLRLSGDIRDGLDRLRWIAGPENAGVVFANADGWASIDTEALARAARVTGLPPSAATLVLADYINSNDGLLLLVQMIYGAHKYLLYIGDRAPTAGEEIVIAGSLNLDNNFDTRINPYRRFGRKLGRELPPAGFDALVAINPVTRWFNLHSNQMVPCGNITFHELAESHAKVALGLNYLSQPSRPGAHNVAIERERRLKSQRPFTRIVLTTGTNRVLRSAEEIKRFISEHEGSTGQR
ncbi:MAG TPA: SPOR domain-containing protein [Blastocatellia bacterium]|nr:SPOR domain-containing protein [Blastocatellia bacterium]